MLSLFDMSKEERNAPTCRIVGPVSSPAPIFSSNGPWKIRTETFVPSWNTFLNDEFIKAATKDYFFRDDRHDFVGDPFNP